MNDPEYGGADQKRRDAITDWWATLSLRDFIARKRAQNTKGQTDE